MFPSAGLRPFNFASLTPLRSVLLVLWAVTLMFSGFAQAAVDLRVEGQTSPVTVFASVTDPNTGAPVTNLSPADFAISLNGGTAVNPASVTLLPGDVSVVFAMDFSGSVQQSLLTSLRASVQAFIDAMQSTDRAAIVKFNNTLGARAVQTFTGDKAALTTALNAPYGDSVSRTNIFDALILSIQQFAPPATLPSGPKAIILVSDGKDNASGADLNEVLSAANQAGIPIFTVNIGAASGPDAAAMQNLAAQTSGEYYHAPDATQLASAYTGLQTRLSNEYVFTLPPGVVPNLCGTPNAIQLNVTGQPSAANDSFETCVAVFVPSLVRLTRSEAITEVATWNSTFGANSTFTITALNETQQFDRNVPVGTVISQTPSIGTRVTVSVPMSVAVSSGPAPATVPNVVGQARTAAESTIIAAQLDVGTVTQQSSATVAAGSVISQSPAAGAAGVREGDDVALVVSTGPAPANNGGGGGGTTSPFEIIAGLLLLALTRLRRLAPRRGMAGF